MGCLQVGEGGEAVHLKLCRCSFQLFCAGAEKGLLCVQDSWHPNHPDLPPPGTALPVAPHLGLKRDAVLEGVLVVQRDPQVVPVVHKVVLGFAGHGDPRWTRCSRGGGGGGGGKKELARPGRGNSGARRGGNEDPGRAVGSLGARRWLGGNPERSGGPSGKGGADAAGVSCSVAEL